MKLSKKQAKTFFRIQRKHNVSVDFLYNNMPAILKFIQYAITPHIVLKTKLIRKRNRIFLRHNHLRKLIFDPTKLKKKQNDKRIHSQWSKRLVMHLRRFHKVVEIIEDEITEVKTPLEDVSKKLKEQLELLKKGKRTVPLLEESSNDEQQMSHVSSEKDSNDQTPQKSCQKEQQENACPLYTHSIDKPKETPVQEEPEENQDSLHETPKEIHNSSVSNEKGEEALLAHLVLEDRVEQSNEKDQFNKELGTEVLPTEILLDDKLEKVGEDEPVTKETCIEQLPIQNTSIALTSTTNASQDKSKNGLITGSNTSFLDMLISKVRNTVDESSDTNIVTPVENVMEPPKQFAKKTAWEVIENNDHENSNSSSDFFGFDDSERVLGTYPGMLSTPLVQNRDSNSAFVSETLNAYMRDNSLENSASIDCPQRSFQDGLVTKHSIPPKIEVPALPEGLQGSRTVAERRAFLQRTKNTKYFMINNILAICRELQKRKKGHRINRHSIESVQNAVSIPMTRQGWKAAAWLLTDIGNYSFQTINVDGKDVRLYGGRGNKAIKLKQSHSSKCQQVEAICSEDCTDKIVFRCLRPFRSPEKRSKIFDSSRQKVYKPGPLSHKILQHALEEDTPFDNLDILRMPKVELEVFPQLQKPLSDIAKRYLQLILPYDKISREWAEFSVSTLLERKKKEMEELSIQKSFTFTLPYTHNRDHVLVRRLYNRSEAFEGQYDNTNLSFRKYIDKKKQDGEDLDELALECADILTDMLNSVAISCSEDSFIKDDPDNINQLALNDDEMTLTKTDKKTVDLHQHQSGHQNKKQSRLLMELKRLNATIIDAAASKTEEDEIKCTKECCRLGCVCASLNEGTIFRQHCGRQKCVFSCNCNCPSVVHYETDGRTITTEDAFMLRRQATAKLARVEKEFTSTIVLTGSETLLINESQYDKKRRCTKIPKRYGDFIDPNDSDFNDNKNSTKKNDSLVSSELPLEPIMVKDIVYKHLKHCRVHLKKLRDVDDLVPWCMVHLVYNCACKGQATYGNPIVIEKQEEIIEDVVIDDSKNRTLYSFDREESRAVEEPESSYDSDENKSDLSYATSNYGDAQAKAAKVEKRGRIADNNYIETYMNAKANHCRRVVPIPKSTYQRRNKKRVAHIQLYIAENENAKTRMSLHEHILRSVYYHKNKKDDGKTDSASTEQTVSNQGNEILSPNACVKTEKTSPPQKRKNVDSNKTNDDSKITPKKSRISVPDYEEGASLLRVNQSKNSNTQSPMSQEQVTIPKISQIFSLNGAVDIASNTAAVATQSASETANIQPGDINADGVKAQIIQGVIKNMNSMVSKKMHDIDVALKRESHVIPTPNDEILCIIRWKNFMEAFSEGLVFLWQVQTSEMTFIAATIKNLMPLIVNAVGVVNIRTMPKDGQPLLCRMLFDKKDEPSTKNLAVIMQGQKMYWIVKGFLLPDETRYCQKPTPETHPMLTKKINVLCKLLITQHVNEQKKRNEALKVNTPPGMLNSNNPTSSNARPTPEALSLNGNTNNIPKLKVLPLQRNISEHAYMILEQMVIQAYGAIRTNINRRKLRKSEIDEIFPPASMASDHHWLVLDITNDFSHIFIPELRDLLTLDRIQKVIDYACVKGRIVKMQFDGKSAFNCYVTPKSRKKVYFGPFRNSTLSPSLILLQSVDVQMMLREVYESVNNLSDRIDKTTAFWLIQKNGNLYLDIESETEPVVSNCPTIQESVHEILDDEESELPRLASNETLDPIIQETSILNESELTANRDRLEQLDSTAIQEVQDDDDDCVIVEDDWQTQPTASALPLSNLASGVSTLSSISKSQPSTFGQSTDNTVPERLNYTISYADENSSLVVIQNECSMNVQDPIQNSFTILNSSGNQQILPMANTSQPIINLSEQQIINLQNSNQQIINLPELIPIQLLPNQQMPQGFSDSNSILNLVSINSDQTNINVSSGINVNSSINSIYAPSATNTSQSAPLTYVTSALPNSINSLPQAVNSLPHSTKTMPQTLTSLQQEITSLPKGMNVTNQTNTTMAHNLQQSIEAVEPPAHYISKNQIDNVSIESTNPEVNRQTIQGSTMQLNKGITIKKLTSTSAANSLLNTTYPVGRPKPILIKQTNQKINTKQVHPGNQTQLKAPQVNRPSFAAHPSLKKIVTTQSVTSPQSAIASRPMQPSTISNPQRKILPNSVNNKTIVGTYVQPLPRTGGLTVRTPTAINTFVKNQQQQQQQQQQYMLSKTSNGLTQFRFNTPQNMKPTLPGQIPATKPEMQTNVTTTTSQASIQSNNSPNKQIMRPVVTTSTNQSFKVIRNSPNTIVTSATTSPNVITVKNFTSTINTTNVSNSPNSNQYFIHKRAPVRPSQTNQTINTTTNSVQPKTLTKIMNPTQHSDPLHIPDKPTVTTKIVPRILQKGLTSSPSSTNISGIKRDSMGTIINRSPVTSTIARPTETQLKSTISTVVTNTNISSALQSSQLKGIPVDVPHVKKFAIISSINNTTVITPPTPTQQSEAATEKKQENTSPGISPTTVDNKMVNLGVNRKVIASGLLKSVLNSSMSPTTKVVSKPNNSPSPSNGGASPSSSTNPDIDYGYFYANVEGLPKFVAKRVKDEFLIKVPNFTGILKLTGLSTVQTYLNKYTSKKCENSSIDFSTVKWTFRKQDRSKLNTANKPPTSLLKTATPIVTKLTPENKNVQSSSPSSTSSPLVNKNDTSTDSIVLLDDD